MANTIYPYFKQLLLSGSINMTTATINVCLIDLTKYTYLPTHQFLSDLTVNGTNDPRLGADQPLTGKTVSSGVFSASGVQFPAIAPTSTYSSIEALVLYQSTGVAATSPLIYYCDTGQGAGLVVTPNGQPITLVWDTSANKIFAL